MKDSKYYKKKYGSKCLSKDKTIILSKLLLSIIVVLVCLIICNFSVSIRNFFKEDVLTEDMKFNKFNKVYKEIFIKNRNEDIIVNDEVSDEVYEEVDGRYKFNYGIDYPVEVLKPGIIVFNGKKDELDNTVIVQGNDGVDIWYSGINLNQYSLYDYVSKKDILGNSLDVYTIITIVKDGKKLKYEEYFK